MPNQEPVEHSKSTVTTASASSPLVGTSQFAIEASPSFVQAYRLLYEHALGESNPVPIKIREFVAIGILLFRGATEAGIERHMRRALDHGATIEELLGIVQATIVPGGAPAYNRGIKILEKIAREEQG